MNTKVNTDGIIYLPQSDIYRIRVGKIIVEVGARTLRQAHNIDMVEKVLRDGSDHLKNDLLDSIARIGGRLVDDLGNDTNANNADKYRDIYLRSGQDPIDALYRGAIDPADTVVACMDLPKPTPYYDPSATPTIYHHDRFPSMPSSSIIDEAIKLLNTKKNLHMTKISVDQIFEGFKLVINSDLPFVQGSNTTLVVVIKHDVFDRAHRTDIDTYAGLKAKLDTDTYIKLRIAFLLYEALKVNKYNKQSIDSDLCEVICFDAKDLLANWSAATTRR